MDVSGGLSVVQTVLKLLDSPIWSEIKSVLGVQSQLEKLRDTICTIEAVLRDAHDQEQLHPHHRRSHLEDNRLLRLREALYRAEDLFDEVTTLALRKQLISGNKWCKEVHLFFSCSNQLCSAFFSSREIGKIREMLDDVVKDHRHNLGSSHHVPLDENRLRFNPRETHSFVSEQDVIIGRKNDEREVIDMLLDSAVGEDVSVVSIVGMGGLGKTTLAQSVYNHNRIAENFPLKLWVCVSDDFDIRIILHKILESARVEFQTSDNMDLKSARVDIQPSDNLEKLQKEVRKALDGKKYILVLDDVWNEDNEKWDKLKPLLMGGARGSRIVVTTRSKKVADIAGRRRHELEGLSGEDSFNLFERMTGKKLKESHLYDVAKAIVYKCARVPLAIRVIGSLLRGQGESTWRHFQDKNLANIKQGENSIVPVLKISYHYLPFYLKSCFLYCAIFPKDHKIMKKELIALWMAQGLITLSDGQNFEDVGEEYFSQLLQKCFFQDLERVDGSDEILSCKMHDLIHDLANEVAGTEILSSNYSISCFNEKTRHIFLDDSVNTEDICSYFNKMKRARTIYSMDKFNFPLRSLDVLSKTRFLRVLKLRNYAWKKLPNVIGKCLHLRYLDLSGNDNLVVLPCTIAKLYNLQTLRLRDCWHLKALPDLSKLVNIRHLDLKGCRSLTHMPLGMNRLKALRSLTGLVVGIEGSVWNCWPPHVGKLGDLRAFTNQSDALDIYVKEGVEYNEVKAIKGVHHSEHLREIMYYWTTSSKNNNAETLLENLKPHGNIGKLELKHYPGAQFPSWECSSMNLNTSLPNLVYIRLYGCEGLEHLPVLSQLRQLKILYLRVLNKLEYVESRGPSGDELVFFPSLEKLVLQDLPELKGWWKTFSERSDVNDTHDNQEQQQGNQSLEVDIERCPQLSTFLWFPKLEEVTLTDVGGKLGFLSSLPVEAFQHVSSLYLREDHIIERLSTIEGLQSNRWCSLRTLSIERYLELKSISGRGLWEHLTGLETLRLNCLRELKLEENEVTSSSGNMLQGERKEDNESNDNDMPWRWLAHSLRVLELTALPALVKLPSGMQHLTALHSLRIESCEKLEEIPGWIGSLSSLQQLYIKYCPNVKSLPEEMCHLTCLTQLELSGCSEELFERCKKPDGADWHKIQHIQSTQKWRILLPPFRKTRNNFGCAESYAKYANCILGKVRAYVIKDLRLSGKLGLGLCQHHHHPSPHTTTSTATHTANMTTTTTITNHLPSRPRVTSHHHHESPPITNHHRSQHPQR